MTVASSVDPKLQAVLDAIHQLAQLSGHVEHHEMDSLRRLVVDRLSKHEMRLILRVLGPLPANGDGVRVPHQHVCGDASYQPFEREHPPLGNRGLFTHRDDPFRCRCNDDAGRDEERRAIRQAELEASANRVLKRILAVAARDADDSVKRVRKLVREAQLAGAAR